MLVHYYCCDAHRCLIACTGCTSGGFPAAWVCMHYYLLLVSVWAVLELMWCVHGCCLACSTHWRAHHSGRCSWLPCSSNTHQHNRQLNS
jgi:hypothetical protein